MKFKLGPQKTLFRQAKAYPIRYNILFVLEKRFLNKIVTQFFLVHLRKATEEKRINPPLVLAGVCVCEHHATRAHTTHARSTNF